MERLGDQIKSHRGFALIEFNDINNTPCSLQASSLAVYDTPGTSAVWLGVDDKRRMHLDRGQVAVLINHLQSWLDTGDF